MAQKLQQGDRFPSLTLRLTTGDSVRLPDQTSSRYVALLFYRGHWRPYCLRQLAAWEGKKAELEALDCTVCTASVDTRERAREVTEKAELTYPVAYGVTREESELFGAWWS